VNSDQYTVINEQLSDYGTLQKSYKPQAIRCKIQNLATQI